MKKILLLLTITSLSFADIKITVEGMTCKSCTEKLKNILTENAKISNIEADLEKKLIQVKMENETELSDETIKKLITDEGYEVTKIER